MQKRGAVELGINTLVVIIISIVILGGGITLLYKFIGGAEDIKRQLDARTEDEITRLLVDQGKQIALPRHIAEIPRGEAHTFGLGILNIYKDANQFTIKVTLDKALNEQGQDLALTARAQHQISESWLLYNQEPINIAEGEHRSEGIFVEVPQEAAKGTYIFNVQVTQGDDVQVTQEDKEYGVTNFIVKAK